MAKNGMVKSRRSVWRSFSSEINTLLRQPTYNAEKTGPGGRQVGP
jgi:hypothetical protein